MGGKTIVHIRKHHDMRLNQLYRNHNHFHLIYWGAKFLTFPPSGIGILISTIDMFNSKQFSFLSNCNTKEEKLILHMYLPEKSETIFY